MARSKAEFGRLAIGVAILAASFGLAQPGSVHPMVQPDSTPDLCPTKEQPVAPASGPGESDGMDATLASLLDTVELLAWAQGLAAKMPVGPDFRFNLVGVSLDAADGNEPIESKHNRLGGPALILGSQGIVSAIDEGVPTPLDEGEFYMVAAQHEFWLGNASGEPAQALMLALLPPDDRILIGAGAVHQVESGPLHASGVESRPLLSGQAKSLERTETRVVLACLRLKVGDAQVEPARFGGPVGLFVLKGEALLGREQRVAAGDCWLFPPHAPVWVRPATDELDVVLFGAWPQGSSIAAIPPGAAQSDASRYQPLPCDAPTSAGVNASG